MIVYVPEQDLDFAIAVFRTYHDPDGEAIVKLIRDKDGLLAYDTDPASASAIQFELANYRRL